MECRALEDGNLASLALRGRTWHVFWRWRGKWKSQSTKVKHDGRSKDGRPVPPAAAKRELRRLEDSLSRGRSYETKTLSQLLEMVESEYKTAGYASIGSLSSRMIHLREFFGSLRADRIEEADFAEYAHHRKPGASNATINRELEMVMKALRMGKIYPLPLFRKLPESAPRQGFFDAATIAALVAALPEYLRGPVMFGYYTGWRREEVFRLEWSAVDFEAGEVRLWDSKSGLPRAFPLDVAPGLRTLLANARATQDQARVPKMPREKVPADTPYVFARLLKRAKRYRRITEFRKAWERACATAGCPGMIFHDLRRSAARNLELAGWPRSMIMAWMGHESESMFHRYRIQSAADRAVVAEMLAKRSGGGVKS